MKTVLEYIDHNRHELAGHPLFTGLRGGGAGPGQRLRSRVAMAAMLGELAAVAEGNTGEGPASPGQLAHRLARLVALAHDAARPAVLHAVEQSGRLLSAYVSKLCECDSADTDSSLLAVDRWELALERLRLARGTEALAELALEENLRQQAMNLVDAVFELVEGSCDALPGGCGPAGATWVAAIGERVVLRSGSSMQA